MILLDTVVVSELRKARPSSRVLRWASRYREEQFFISVVTLGELERGVAGARDPAFRIELERWLDGLQRLYNDRLLDVTAPVARLWGRWSAQLGRADVDLMIAATAEIHGMTVATRNVRHFAPTGVAVVDPFA